MKLNNEFFAVWNTEEHVGKFFCGAFTTQELAEAYIASLNQYDVDQHEESKKILPIEYHEYKSFSAYSWSKESFDRAPLVFVENI